MTAAEEGEPRQDHDPEREQRPDSADANSGAQPAPDTKRALFRPLPPAPPFPIHALGALREPAEAVHERTQAPLAMCAQSVLAGATLAIQAHRDIELPGVGRRPLTGFYASIAESGERKSTTDRLVLAPVYFVEAQWRQEYEAEAQTYQNDNEAWKSARNEAKKKHRGNREALRDALNAIGAEPKPPPLPMLLVADPTPEALILQLRDSRPWGGLFASEGGVLIGGHAFNDESRMRTAALLNTIWDGDPIRRARVLTGTAYLPGRRCSVHVMLQPAISDKLLSDALLDGIGLLARVLVVAPESTAGTRLFRQPSSRCEVVLATYNKRLTELLLLPPRTAPESADVLDPPEMTLRSDAEALWIEFHDAVERDLAPGGTLHPIRAFAAKMPEHAGRIAAILTVYADLGAQEITADAVACGIELAKYYAAELLRLQGAAQVAPDLRLAARLLEWWQRRPDPRCYLAEIYQRSLNAISDAGSARRIVQILQDHAWVRPLKEGTVLDGARRREAWVLVE
jgi:hypothetical protein